MHQAALKPTKGPPLPVTARPLGIRSDPNGIPAGVTSPPLGHPMPKSDQLLALVVVLPLPVAWPQGWPGAPSARLSFHCLNWYPRTAINYLLWWPYFP